MAKGWLIWQDDLFDVPNAMVFLNETEALEMFMSICEEELYITFLYMTQDEMETMDLQQMVQYVYADGYVDWCVKEVPIYGDIGC
jgi:hypothetical protein